MTLTDLYNILCETLLPVAYQGFKPEENIKLPCITYAEAFSANFGADNFVYSPFTRIDIFFWEETMGAESILEDVLQSHQIYWEKTITWMNDEKCYQIIYEVTINA